MALRPDSDSEPVYAAKVSGKHRRTHHTRLHRLVLPSTCSKRIKLHLAYHKIYSYEPPNPLPPKGVITADISTESQHLSAKFHMVDGNSGNLLCYTTACQLSLLQVTINSTTHNQLTSIPRNSNTSSLALES